jgi:hypothetical protein
MLPADVGTRVKKKSNEQWNSAAHAVLSERKGSWNNLGSHLQKERHFDAEDKRLLEILSQFAAVAYRVLDNTGSLDPLLTV